MSSPPLRVVIDTNVCLDLFVFQDPRWQLLMQRLQDGSITAITKKECRDEWLSVLHYEHLPINDDTRPHFELQFDQYIQCVDVPNKLTKLPLCTDKDDQKFLDISRDTSIDVLITKDKALLKLAKKLQKLGLFIIESPEKFIQRITPTTL